MDQLHHGQIGHAGLNSGLHRVFFVFLTFFYRFFSGGPFFYRVFTVCSPFFYRFLVKLGENYRTPFFFAPGILPELSIKLPHGGAKCDTGTDCILGSLTSGKEGFNKKPILDANPDESKKKLRKCPNRRGEKTVKKRFYSFFFFLN